MEYIRDFAMYASVFGMFGVVWFGWAQERPKESWRLPLGIASGFSLLACLAGVYYSVTNWDAPSALNDSSAFGSYLFAFYGEFVIGGIGAFLLIRKKRKDYVAPWIALVVGLHFISLKSVFDDAALYLLAALLILVSVASPFLSRRWQVANSAVTGIGSGTVLFGFALLGLIRFWSA